MLERGVFFSFYFFFYYPNDHFFAAEFTLKYLQYDISVLQEQKAERNKLPAFLETNLHYVIN